MYQMTTNQTKTKELKLNHMIMTFRWLPECASLLNTYKSQWLRRIPLNPEAPVIALEFFSWVASLMSLQLRTLVSDSLKDLFNFICIYQV